MLPSGCGTRSFGELKRLAVEFVGEHRHRAVVLPAHDAAEKVLRRNLAALEVERVAVAVEGRIAEGAHLPGFPDVAILDAGLHVAEDEILALGTPGRALGPVRAGPDPPDLRNAEQRRAEIVVDDDDVVIGIFGGRGVRSPLARRIGQDARWCAGDCGRGPLGKGTGAEHTGDACYAECLEHVATGASQAALNRSSRVHKTLP